MHHSLIAATQWTFGINDPSLIAWLIFIVYFVTAILCWRARAGGLPAREPGTRVLWTALSFFMIVLGLNKQLDLHVLVVNIGRDLMQNGSLVLRGGILAGAGVLGLLVLGFSLKFLRGSNPKLRWTYGIFFGLLGVQILRFLPGPISGLLVAHVFGEEEGLFHIHIIELLELGSLSVIGLLAWLSVRKNEAKK